MVEAPTWLVMPGYRYYGQQEELDFNKPNNAIGEYKQVNARNWLNNRL